MLKKIVDGYIKIVQRLLPSPFTIAFGLTAIVILLALFLTRPNEIPVLVYSYQIFDFWGQGLWSLLEFSAQMMLILVLGHAIALSKPVDNAISFILGFCNNNAQAAFTVSLFSLLAGFLNWGFGLIFGAIFAAKAAQKAANKGFKLNYPLIAACGYVALMVWHGGLSGSAPLTVAQQGHSLQAQMGIIPLNETIFSYRNIFATLLVLLIIPVTAYFLGKSQPGSLISSDIITTNTAAPEAYEGAEKLDSIKWIGYFTGIMLLIYWVYSFISSAQPMNYLGLNTINLLFLGLALLLHGSVKNFLWAVDDGIKGASGILIQFPLYAGIMGIMRYSGLLDLMAISLIEHANSQTLPVVSYISAAVVNIFIPSGGGQWQIQGPVLVEAAKNLQVNLGDITMSLAYGDELTNMLQPFWALPLLSITRLKAKDILPYSIIFMLVAFFIFLSVLWF